MGESPFYYKVPGQILAVTILELPVVQRDHRYKLLVNHLRLDTAQSEGVVESNYKDIY